MVDFVCCTLLYTNHQRPIKRSLCISPPINLHKKVTLFCWTRRTCSGTSSSTRRAWRRCWRSVTSCSTMPTPAAATRRTTRSSRRPAAWTAAGGTSVPCPWRGGWGERSETRTTLQTEILRLNLYSYDSHWSPLLLSGSRRPGVSGVSSWTTSLASKTGWRHLSSQQPTRTLPTSSTPALRRSWRSSRWENQSFSVRILENRY